VVKKDIQEKAGKSIAGFFFSNGKQPRSQFVIFVVRHPGRLINE
jgi:hypothetical protein